MPCHCDNASIFKALNYVALLLILHGVIRLSLGMLMLILVAVLVLALPYTPGNMVKTVIKTKCWYSAVPFSVSVLLLHVMAYLHTLILEPQLRLNAQLEALTSLYILNDTNTHIVRD